MNFARLTPPDTRAIAEAGCYVYCYLRNKDSATAPAGTPYYIGIASNEHRPFKSHRKTPVPANKAFVRILRSGLSWYDACKWEQFYIKRYGRKDVGTGFLRNLTDGGEGSTGAKISEETRAKMSAALKGKTPTEQTRAKISAAKKGMAFSAEHCANLSAARKNPSFETRLKMSEAQKGKTFSAEHCAKISESLKGKTKSPEARANMSAAQKGKTLSAAHVANIRFALKGKRGGRQISQMAAKAQRHGIPMHVYEKLSNNQRHNLDKLAKNGRTAQDVLAMWRSKGRLSTAIEKA